MYEKMALTLINDYEVHIIGQENKESKELNSNIFFHKSFHFFRNSLQRFSFYLFFFRKLKQISPNILLVNTPELLVPAFLYRIMHKTKIIYDVRENYFYNLWYQKNYPRKLKYFLAITIRILEYFSHFFVKHYFLAEQCYAHEFNFSKNKHSILENKYLPIFFIENHKKSVKNWIQFVYTGTISITYGTLEAICFIKKIHKFYPNIRFTIIGCCSNEKYAQQIRKSVENENYIFLVMSPLPIPHQKIIEQIQDADFAVLSYLPNKSTKNCIPSKIYEYLAQQIPMIIPKNSLWEKICEPHQAAISIDFEQENIENLVKILLEKKFYPEGQPDEKFWKFDQKAFLDLWKRIVG
ncbi:MAG: hypothetical protein EAZ97_12335 [Bacteroidetes bacterium]|nr:MAG: hypothetical protein EAZ97_12335 [Bacteroidota bacterium]